MNIMSEKDILDVILRYAITIFHLKPIQIFGRIFFRLYKPRPASSRRALLRETSMPFAEPCRRSVSMIGPVSFVFLNRQHTLIEVGWNGPQVDKLWRYNQHYFDDLNAINSELRRAWHEELIADWVANNPPGFGDGWEPYPTSLRIVNWIKWALKEKHSFNETALDSLAMQSRWLSKRIEWHLLGNHLFANAKALIFSGLFFEGEEADRWAAKGISIVSRQLAEQFLPDGGQFELSPMYHSIATEDVLDLINLMQSYSHELTEDGKTLLSQLKKVSIFAISWLQSMSHPDGDLSFFNDCAFGIAPKVQYLEDYARRIGILDIENGPMQTCWLKDTGYVRVQSDDAVLITDIARIGPDYLPGHAHADTLSFELSIKQQRVFVNGGTSLYGNCLERHRQRGTVAHNTVNIGNKNSSDVWAGFRVGRRAHPISPKVVIEKGGETTIEAGHNGYRFLPGKPIHYRRWAISNGELEILDQISNPTLRAEARYYLHPDVKIDQWEENEGALILQSGETLCWKVNGSVAQIHSTTWHPQFGMSVPNRCIVVPINNGSAHFRIAWS